VFQAGTVRKGRRKNFKKIAFFLEKSLKTGFAAAQGDNPGRSGAQLALIIAFSDPRASQARDGVGVSAWTWAFGSENGRMKASEVKRRLREGDLCILLWRNGRDNRAWKYSRL